jgi:hypothetical protein
MITHFEKMADRLAIAMSRHQAEKELLESKAALEERVRNAVNELRQKDQALIQQSRMAAMGEMIGNIAHQWQQPLNTLSLIVANIQDAYQFSELNAEYMDQAAADCHRLIQKMSSTISDFFIFFVRTRWYPYFPPGVRSKWRFLWSRQVLQTTTSPLILKPNEMYSYWEFPMNIPRCCSTCCPTPKTPSWRNNVSPAG